MNAHAEGTRIAVALAVIGLLAATVRADVVCTYSRQFNLRIPAGPDTTKGWMENAIIDVPSHLIIEDLDVSVSLTHSSVFDLQLFLESPSGTVVLLNMYDLVQGYITGEDYAGTIFDDEADTPIEAGTAPFTGSFRPLESLSIFDGEDAYGPWKFRVADAYYNDTGHFDAYTLLITVPEPATVAFFLLGSGLVGSSLLRRRH